MLQQRVPEKARQLSLDLLQGELFQSLFLFIDDLQPPLGELMLFGDRGR